MVASSLGSYVACNSLGYHLFLCSVGRLAKAAHSVGVADLAVEGN